MSVRYSVSEDIAAATGSNPDLARLHQAWQRRGSTGRIPRVDALPLDQFEWCLDQLMLLEHHDDDYRYLHYGRAIARDAGFDMTGKSTRDFASPVGDFFRTMYDRCAERGRPLYTVHRANHAAAVLTWERLLLPLAGEDGVVARILVYNRPLSFRTEILVRVLEASPSAVLALEPVNEPERGITDFIVRVANPAAFALAAGGVGDLVDQRLLTAFPDLGEALLPELGRVCEQGEPITIERWLRLGSGDVCLRVTANWIGGGLTTTFTDITLLKLQERALNESNARLQEQADLLQRKNRQLSKYYEMALQREGLLSLFVGYAPAAVAMFDRDMHYLLYSHRWSSDFGLSDRDIVGVRHDEVFPNAPARWKDAFARCLGGEVAGGKEDPFRRADGTVQYVTWELRPWYDAGGAIGGAIMLAEVVTEEVVARRKLEERARLLGDAESLAEIGHWRFDTRLEKLFWSEGIFRIHGLDPATDPIPSLETAIAFYHPADRPDLERELGLAMTERRPFEFAHRLIRVDGEERRVLGRGRVVLDENDEVTALFGTLMDDTERQEINRQLHEKNRRLAKLYDTACQFVDNVSHEFRTPLTVIKEFASILKDGVVGEVNAEQTELLDMIVSRGEDLGMMVDDMLDISRLEAGLLRVRRRPSTADTIIHHVFPMLAARSATRRIDMDLEIARDLPVVFCDVEKAGRVIVNLVSNALKFSPERSTVTLWAKRNDAGDVTIGVTDRGAGIAPDQVELIFNRFKQGDGQAHSSTKGFGLGLNIVRELVRLNVGEVGLESHVGEGSTFWFTVPRAEPEHLLKEMLARREPPPRTVSVAMLTGETEEDGPGDLSVADFLAEQIRADDLSFPAGEQRWLVAMCGSWDEMSGLIDRVHRAYRRAGEGRVGGPLPPFDLVPLRTFRVDDQRAELLEFWARAIDDDVQLKEAADAA